MHRYSFVALFALLIAPATGCSSSAVDVCQEAQEQSCTSIKGSCQSFYDAVKRIGDKSSCTAEVSAYETCAEEASDSCAVDAQCIDKENAMVNCATPYCASHSDDADCATVTSSL